MTGPRTGIIHPAVADGTEIQYIGFMSSDRFDPTKDMGNRRKHGLSLTFGDRIFDDPDHLILASFREIDGEERFKVIGLVETRLFTGVFGWRNDLPRFISVRRSNPGEERAYRTAL